MSGAKTIGFYAIGVFLFVLLAEALSFTVGLIQPELFSYEDEYFASLVPALFEQWKSSPWFDAVLGWNTPAGVLRQVKKNCLGQDIKYTYQDQQRGIPLPGDPVVALFGDSYTSGLEVDDDSTMSAALERSIHGPVLNFGIGGSGPDQSVLKFERLAASKRKMPKLEVLVIMHENIRRVVNSFRPVLTSAPDDLIAFKPYIANGTWVGTQLVSNYEQFLTEARRRFREDFWSKPRFSFPYLLSLIRAISSNSFFYNVASWGKPRYSYEYSTENPLLVALTIVIDRWQSSVLAAGDVPFVLFVPAEANDRGISLDYVKHLNVRAGRTFAFSFDDSSMDWARYKLKRSGGCHPTPYGQERIAAFIAQYIVTSTISRR